MAAKTHPRAPRRHARAAKQCPKSEQGPIKTTREHHKSGTRAPQEPPKSTQTHPRATKSISRAPKDRHKSALRAQAAGAAAAQQGRAGQAHTAAAEHSSRQRAETAAAWEGVCSDTVARGTWQRAYLELSPEEFGARANAAPRCLYSDLLKDQQQGFT